MTQLSVIIPAYNDAEHLEELLETVRDQQFEDYEVIVKDAESTDDTEEVAKSFDVQFVSSEDHGPGDARNQGVEKAEGDIVLFLDADTRLMHEKVFDNVIETMQDDSVVGGSSTWKTYDTNIRGKLMLGAGSFMMKIANMTGVMTAGVGTFMFVDRKVFQHIGGYDAELPYHEDHALLEELEEYGEIKILDKQVWVSGRRVSQRGMIGTFMDYIPPSLNYMVGREEYVKEKYTFRSSSGN
ncbi:MAG: glycosyltransferase involved in cell wall biosynthesis [Candidatus Nanohaloarchaea archaeon]|jgi:glycosyltransferase involved in cell wall biosynthesis